MPDERRAVRVCKREMFDQNDTEKKSSQCKMLLFFYDVSLIHTSLVFYASGTRTLPDLCVRIYIATIN